MTIRLEAERAGRTTRPVQREGVARAARERSEQERETTGFGAPAVFNPRTFLDQQAHLEGYIGGYGHRGPVLVAAGRTDSVC